MPAFTHDFRPHPLLAGGHRQTLIVRYLSSRVGLIQTRRHTIELDDGDHLVLHEDCPLDWRPSDPSTMLVHGLCGSHRSRYVARIALKLYQHRIRVFRLDLRGCGAGQTLARTWTHCGRDEDLRPPIARIAELAPESPLTVVGFSLGAALTLGLAATGSIPANWTQAVAVCPPIDLFAVERLLAQPIHGRYDQFFTRRLWKMAIEREQRVAGAMRVSHLQRPLRLRQFDEQLTAPMAGYRDADDYYSQASVGSRLARIELPTRILASANDPIVPAEPLKTARFGPRTQLLITTCGGHLGFYGCRGSDPDRYWLDWRIVDWVIDRACEN